MSGLGKFVRMVWQFLFRLDGKIEKLVVTKSNFGFREREFCGLCEETIDYSTAHLQWYNVDISRGHTSWCPFCEIVLCEKCVKEKKEECVRVIMDLLR